MKVKSNIIHLNEVSFINRIPDLPSSINAIAPKILTWITSPRLATC